MFWPLSCTRQLILTFPEKPGTQHTEFRCGLTITFTCWRSISHLFSVGILHSDVKGNNVVVEDTGGVKRGVLIDFGKACSVENATGLFDISLF